MNATAHHRARIADFLFSDFYRLLLILGVLLYVALFTGLAFDLHTGMRTHKADLGQMDQAIWNTSQFRFVEQIQNDYLSTRLTDHVEPIFALIAPVLWLWGDVRVILLMQVMAVALGAFPLYSLALEKLDQILPQQKRRQIWHREPLQQMTRPIALALAVCYLLAPQMQSAVLTEFHAIPFAAPLILWSLWATEKRHWGQFAIATLLLASVKEEAALLAAGLGAWALWRMVGYWGLGIRDWGLGSRDWGSGIGDWGLGTGDRGKDTDGNQYPNTQYPNTPIPNTPIPKSPIILALTVTLLSLAWFYLTTFVIVPFHAAQVYDVAESTYFQRYGALGSSPADIFRSFFTQPGLVWQIATEPARLDYLWGLFMPFGFLALLAPELILIALPVLLANQLSAYPAQYYGEFHYSAPILPYFAAASAYGAARLWRILARRFAGESGSFQHMPAASATVMALVSLFTNSRTALRPLLAGGMVLWLLAWGILAYGDAGRGPLGGRYDPTPITAHHRLLPRFVAQIPRDAAVSATAAVHPHVSQRRFIYQFPWGVEAADGAVTDLADWALIDVTTNTDMAPGDVKATVERMLGREWGVVDAADGFLLLAKGAAAKEIPDAFYSFVRPNPQYPISNPQSPPSSPLTLLEVETLDWPRWRQTKVTTLWRVEADFVPGRDQPWEAILTPGGETVITNEQLAPPALVWYPPERWQPGEVIRVESLWLFLPRHWTVITGVMGPGGEIAHTSVAAAFSRDRSDRLLSLPVAAAEWGEILPRVGGDENESRGSFQLDPLSPEPTTWVRGWLPRHAHAGQSLDLWLRWEGAPPDLWQDHIAFIHLRREGETVAQADGLPRYGLPSHAMPDPIPDWRQIPLPADLPAGPYEVVVGLFTPASGERLLAFDAGDRPSGNELLLGPVEIRPPLVPDQACALIPLTCASQGE